MATTSPDAAADLVSKVILPTGGFFLAGLTYFANNAANRRREQKEAKEAEEKAKAAAILERDGMIGHLNTENKHLRESVAECDAKLEAAKARSDRFEDESDHRRVFIRSAIQWMREAHEGIVAEGQPEYPPPPKYEDFKSKA